MVRKLPKGIRKYIRKEKARIRWEVFDKEEQEKKIEEIYQKFLPQNPKKSSHEISHEESHEKKSSKI